jgi:hypothetical protein
MGKFQIRKRVKLAPGLSLNVSKRGLGFSAGPRGLKASLSSQGKLTGSTGLPGTGISYRKTLNSNGESELAESEDNSLLLSIADNAAYIAIHGPVMSGKEMMKALILLRKGLLLEKLYKNLDSSLVNLREEQNKRLRISLRETSVFRNLFVRNKFLRKVLNLKTCLTVVFKKNLHKSETTNQELVQKTLSLTRNFVRMFWLNVLLSVKQMKQRCLNFVTQS